MPEVHFTKNSTRILVGTIDFILYGIMYLFSLYLFYLPSKNFTYTNGFEQNYFTLNMFCIFFGSAFIYLLYCIVFKTTFGLQITNNMIIDKDGYEVKRIQLLLRGLILCTPIIGWIINLVSLILLLTIHTTIHDLIAQTLVVKNPS
jgi:uncharacterized RDD family membrane protein YckC